MCISVCTSMHQEVSLLSRLELCKCLCTQGYRHSRSWEFELNIYFVLWSVEEGWAMAMRLRVTGQYVSVTWTSLGTTDGYSRLGWQWACKASVAVISESLLD